MSKKYRSSSIQKFLDYLGNKLNQKEQHALEKQLLDDGFEGEAMEGFEGLVPDELSSDLMELELRVDAKNKKPVTNTYLRVAAVFSLLLSATVTIIYFAGINEQKGITQKSSEHEESLSKNAPEAIKTDSVLLSNNDKAEDTAILNINTQADEIQEKSDEILAYPTEQVDDENSAIIQSDKLEIQPAQSRNTSGLTSGNGIKETRLEPLPDTRTLNRVATSEVLPTDDAKLSEKEFEIPSSIAYNEAMKEKPVGADAYSESISKAARKTNEPNESKKSQSETSTRYFEDENYELTPLPYPEIGMDEYILYLKKSLSFIPADSALHINLLISDSGKIIQISTLENLSRKGQKELEKIIDSGPGWVPASVKGISVEKLVEINIQW